MARLTTKGLQPGMSFGGKPVIERMDIAAACSRLSPLTFHLVMAKYCDDVHSALEAMTELQAVMAKKSAVWAEMGVLKRTAVAAAMIQEFVSARKCGSCKGTGQVKRGTKIEDCRPCSATGAKTISASARARACGIPESTFRHQRLNERYNDIMDLLARAEIGALESISRKAS
ncbi:hypothetical protein [Marinobacter sp.]|uniref:hypothetical protein n=1 Tax=Marinobacter sp. TaxID=50741 RepID=UPI003A8E4F65